MKEKILLVTNAKKETGVHYTLNHTGKMAGMMSLSTSCLCNPHCQAYSKNPEAICSYCYANTLLKVRTVMQPCLQKNAEILSNKVLKREEVDKKYTWNLSDIYSSLDDFRSDAKEALRLAEELVALTRKIGECAANLLSVFTTSDEIQKLYGYLVYIVMNELGDGDFYTMYEILSEDMGLSQEDISYLLDY